MFRLQLKGFKPLPDMDIASEDNIFGITGDESIGVDFFIGLLHRICRMIAGVDVNEIFTHYYQWNMTAPKEIEFCMEFDDISYRVILKKKSRAYLVKMEELIEDVQVLLHHTGTKCNLGQEVSDTQLCWNLLRSQPFLDAMKSTKFRAPTGHLLNTMSPEDYAYTIRTTFREVSYRAGFETYINELTGVYRKRKKQTERRPRLETGTKENKLYHSWKMRGILDIICDLMIGEKIIWHPEAVIEPNKSSAFQFILYDFAKTKPLFVVSDNANFWAGRSVVKLTCNGTELLCECSDH